MIYPVLFDPEQINILWFDDEFGNWFDTELTAVSIEDPEPHFGTTHSWQVPIL